MRTLSKNLFRSIVIGASLTIASPALAAQLGGGHTNESAEASSHAVATESHAAAADSHAAPAEPHGSAAESHSAAAEGGHGLKALAAVANQGGHQPAAAHGSGHWDYGASAGPATWGDISADYHQCKVGQTQSPIDLNDGIEAEVAEVEFDYEITPLKPENNGHTIVAHYGAGSGIWVEGQRFELLQFHFHAPSEHTINGVPAAMEIHFVHKNAAGQLAVVGVMVEQGQDNLALSEIWSHLPKATGPAHSVDGVMVNGRDFLPNNRAYFRYMGSLTTPPCSEGVNWFVMTTPIQASVAQTGRFAALFGPNARPVQDVNNRLVLVP